MRAISSVVGCAFWLVAGSTYAIRHQQQAGNLAPAEVVGNVAATLSTADEIISSHDYDKELINDMRDQMREMGENFVDTVCTKAPEDSNCRQMVALYADRCEMYGCLQIDNVNYPVDEEYQPLSLPNPYQLDAAFTLFKNSASNPAKNGVKGQWMRFRNGKKHGDYHRFLIGLLAKGVTRKDGATDLEFLVNKLLYMATTYYKTYLIVNNSDAKFFNRIAFATKIFGFGIKKALKDIVRSNVPEYMGEHSIERISHLAHGYKDYMLTQVPTLSKFAERYSDMVMKVLLSSLAGYVKAPWYKRWFNKVKDFFVNKIGKPTKEHFHKKHPRTAEFFDKMHERTKDFFENKIGAPTKDFFENKIGAPTKDFFENKIGAPTKDFFENKIGAPTKDFFENKIGAPTKDFFENKIGAPTKDFFENKIGAPTKDFFENKIGAPTKDFFENKLPEHTKDFFENKIGAPIKESFENLGHKRPVNWRYISSPQRMNNDSVADVATETVDMENHDGGNTVGEMFV